MIKFYLFLKKIHFLLIFIILEAFAIRYYANSSNYTKMKMVLVSNYVVGGVYSQLSGFNSYFHLKRENRELAEELSRVRNQLDAYRLLPAGQHAATGWGARADSIQVMAFDTTERRYEYYTAEVVNNSVTHQENYIVLDKGERDNFEPNMALVSQGSIVGYTLGCSNRFSVCMSILNRNFRTSGKLKNSDFFGTVYWDGLDSEVVTLSEMSKYAKIEPGDTVVTTNYSSIFPPDLLIGTVVSFELKNDTYFEIKVKLAGNLASLNNIIAVKYLDAEERRILEQSILNPDAL